MPGGARIVGATDAAKAFVEQWLSPDGFITAHTSGSTGPPKEIHLAKEDMRRSARATNSVFGIGPDSVLALPLSVDYIAGKMMIVRAIEAGCTLHILNPSSDPSGELEAIGVIDLLAIVPAQIRGLVDSGALFDVVNVIVGGAPMTESQENALVKAPCNCFATYGMTETCSHVALRRVGCGEFAAMPGISFTADSRGCLVVNAPTFTFGTLVTNDSVELIDTHTFRWLGRADNVINSGGVKIHPEEIEKELALFMRGRAFYVTGRPSEKWGTELIAVIEGKPFDPAPTLAAAKAALPAHKAPKALVFVKKIPRTSSGKIIRGQLS